jgi:hypothetical protein
MTTLTPQSGQLSLIELANRQFNGMPLDVIEVLAETNEFLADAVWLEANGIGGHTFVQRTSLPAGSFRQINDGVAAENSTTKQVTESIGMLEAFSQVDEALVALSANPDAFRRLEDMAFVEGLGQTLADTFIYGDTDLYPQRFKGLDRRVTSKTASNATAGSGSGSDTTSIWVVKWGPRGAYFCYPRGSQIGLTMENLGRQRVAGTTGTYMAYVTHFKLMAGLCVADNRAIQRICNIESAGTTNIFDEDDLITVLNRMNAVPGRAAIYCNATIKTQIEIAAKDKANVTYLPNQFGGLPVTYFRGVPIRQIDAITNTETALS